MKRRVVSVLLALVLALGVIVPAWAEGVEEENIALQTTDETYIACEDTAAPMMLLAANNATSSVASTRADAIAARVDEYTAACEEFEKATGNIAHWTIDSEETFSEYKKSRDKDSETATLKQQVDRGDFKSALSAKACPEGGNHKWSGGNFNCRSHYFSGIDNTGNGYSQCQGFANYMAYVLFGKAGTDIDNFEKITNIDYTFDFQPGDIVRALDKSKTNGHSMVVYEGSGSSAKVIECNWGHSNRGYCNIRWDKTVGSKSGASLYPYISYVLRPKATLQVTATTATVNSGYCGGEGDGKNLTWTLDSEGVLTISGKGAMPYMTFDEKKTYGWTTSSVTEVIIEQGVTIVGDVAFSNQRNLTKVTLPDSLTSIAPYAFTFCSSLSSITIPESVTEIGNAAFYGCDSLTSITIPASVTTIYMSAFSRCKSLLSIQVDSANQYFSSKEGVLFSKNGDALYCYPSAKKGSTYHIPESVTWIDSEAFSGCIHLKNITVPNSLDSLCNAFIVCDSLTNIYLPNSITSIDPCTFASCQNLSSITIPNSVTSIEFQAFENCERLTSITIPASVTSIGRTAFLGCNSLKDVYYRGSAAEWNRISIASGNEALTSATIHFNQTTVKAAGTTQEVKVGTDGKLAITVPNVVNNKEAATVTFDQAAVKKISGYGDLTLTVKDNTADLPSNLRNAVEVKGKNAASIVIELTGADGTPVFTEGKSAGKAVVTIPYKAGLLTENIKVFYVNGNKLTNQEFTYNRLTGVVTLTLEHFSEYLITSESEAVPTPTPAVTTQRRRYTAATATAAADTKVNSASTFDAGVGIYAVSAILSVTGMAWVGRKKH